MAAVIARMQKELRSLETYPSPGVSVSLVDGALNHMLAHIVGPDTSVYEGGVFLVDVRIPERYVMSAHIQGKVSFIDLRRATSIFSCPSIWCMCICVIL